MTRSQKVARLIIASCLLITPFSMVFAEQNIQLDAVIGVSIPSNSAFKDDTAAGVSLTYADSALSYRIGYINYGDFSLKNGNFDSRIKIAGNYLELIKIFQMDVANLELGIGLIAAQSTLYFDGERILDDSDTSPFAEIIFTKDMSNLITLHAGVGWTSDVSGSDITTPKAGIRFSF